MNLFERAVLVLEDGTCFLGFSFGAPRSCAGEVVFNTGMVGYVQSLTDPSYLGQILALTYPLIGNYGVSGQIMENLDIHYESEKIQVQGLVVADYSDDYSHWDAQRSLSEWLIQQNIPAITGVDTRSLTKHLRTKGAMLGKIITGQQSPASIDFYDPNKENLVARASCKEAKRYGPFKKHIALIDCGTKWNILRELLRRNVSVTVVPWDYDVNALAIDGLMISNGPGDPMMASSTVSVVREFLKKKLPVWGICMGNQVLALAAGAKTYKLKFGHRGQNQPCREAGTKRCIITSQNHGFAVDATTLPDGWEEWFVNANDGSNEGIRHRTMPFRSIQFHPEASPGPTDANYLFDEFVRLL